MSEHFNEKAADWDANDMVKGISSAVGTAILEQIGLNEKMQVMDFGAGTGLISSHVAPLVNKITAVDTSEAMLKQLVSKPGLHGKVEPLCQDIIEHPIQDRFDLIMSAMAMHHVEDTRKLLQRFSEHLKRGAHIALADLDKEDGSFHPPDTPGVFHSGFARDELQASLAQCGFTDIQFVTAHTVNKEGKEYPIFLVRAVKG